MRPDAPPYLLKKKLSFKRRRSRQKLKPRLKKNGKSEMKKRGRQTKPRGKPRRKKGRELRLKRRPKKNRRKLRLQKKHNRRLRRRKAKELVKTTAEKKPKEAEIRMGRIKIFLSKSPTNLITSKTRQMILMINTVIGSKKTCGFWASST